MKKRDKKLMLKLGEAILQYQESLTIPNEDRISQVKTAHGLCRKFTDGEGLTVDMELHKPFKSMGSVSVKGKNVVFVDSDVFRRITTLASTFDVYPKTNGTIQVDFGFNGLMTKERK